MKYLSCYRLVSMLVTAFHVGRITLSPEVNLDFVAGGTRVFYLGLAVGAGF